MTRFLFISDTHAGAAPMGFQQQKGYPEFLPRIITGLSEFIQRHGGIDFVLHGGDMIDFTSAENLKAARELFGLPVPTYLCLGNHDLTTPDAAEVWLKHAPDFFPGNRPEFTIERDDCLIHVMPNHWQDEPFYWRREQRPHFKESQLEWIEQQLSRKVDFPHILLTHSPTLPVPPEQTGMDRPFHDPGCDFTKQIRTIITGKTHVKYVLGGHNHVNMCRFENGTAYVTASALVETPFEFKLFEVSPETIQMETVTLKPMVGFESDYNQERAYIQGRAKDRNLKLEF